jgi:hypothetical protein
MRHLSPEPCPESGPEVRPAATRQADPSDDPDHPYHPNTEILELFMRGELTSPGERRRLVRHLLAGCPRCLAVTRRCWVLVDPSWPEDRGRRR